MAFDLAEILRDAGLDVVVFPPPSGYSKSWASGGPVGQMVHHTAGPNPYPMDSLSGRRDGLVKCNIAPRQDGQMYVVTSHACNYSSGSGSRSVIDDARRGIAPTASASKLNLRDDANGNPWFINYEVDHPGDGSPIADAQWEALVVALVAVSDALGLSYDSTVAHGEFTKRKVDPRWNGRNLHQNLIDIRTAMHSGAVTPPTLPPPDTEGVPVADFQMVGIGDGFVPGTYDRTTNRGRALPKGDPMRNAVELAQAWLAARGYKASVTFNAECDPDGLAGRGTDQAIRDFQSDKGMVVDGIVGPKTWTALAPIA